MSIELLTPVQPHWKVTVKKSLLAGPHTTYDFTQGGVLLYRATGLAHANEALAEIREIKALTERLLR